VLCATHPSSDLVVAQEVPSPLAGTAILGQELSDWSQAHRQPLVQRGSQEGDLELSSFGARPLPGHGLLVPDLKSSWIQGTALRPWLHGGPGNGEWKALKMKSVPSPEAGSDNGPCR